VKTTRVSLFGLAEAEPVDLFAVVETDDLVTSPLTGARAAVVVVDLVERATPLENEAGRAVLGDTLVLRADGGEVVIVARLARYAFVSDGARGEVRHAPPEIAFLLSGARGKGTLGWREHLLRRGARVHLRAVVAPSAQGRFVARDDRAPVLISEPLLD
jgi:hypothetical protein